MKRRWLVAALVFCGLLICGPPPGARTAPAGPPALWYIGFSPRLPPAESLLFRQAIAYALDRPAIATSAAAHGPAQPATTIQHPDLPGYNAGVRGYAFDPAKARELFAQAGWTAPITILAGPGPRPWVAAIEEAMVRSLSTTLGAVASITQVANFDALVRASRSGSAPMWTYGWYSVASDYAYPSFPLALANAYFLSDPEIKVLVERRDAIAVEQVMLDKALLIPVVHYRYISN